MRLKRGGTRFGLEFGEKKSLFPSKEKRDWWKGKGREEEKERRNEFSLYYGIVFAEKKEEIIDKIEFVVFVTKMKGRKEKGVENNDHFVD